MRTHEPSGFVNCAAHYTAPLRLASILRVGSNKNSPLSFLLANAHVASCGWLGIHEADYEAFGFGVGVIPKLPEHESDWLMAKIHFYADYSVKKTGFFYQLGHCVQHQSF
jgi:hypothetical protein